MAQRLRFQDQKVTLPGGAPVLDRISDLLLGGSINWDPRWSFDGTVQFNPNTEQSVRSTLGARYNPGSYRTLSVAYRYQRDASEQLDLGWQWPAERVYPPATVGCLAQPLLDHQCTALRQCFLHLTPLHSTRLHSTLAENVPADGCHHGAREPTAFSGRPWGWVVWPQGGRGAAAE